VRTSAGLGRGQRWLLACLCLLASLGYLTRTTEIAGPLLLSPFQGQVQTVQGLMPAPYPGERSSTPAHLGQDVSFREQASANAFSNRGCQNDI